MKTIYLVRHGEVEPKYKKRFRGRIDCELSPWGVEMSQANARYLLSQGVERVLTSGMKRTQYVADQFPANIPTSVDLRFREADFGAWEGMSWAEIEKKFPDLVEPFRRDPDAFRFPGGDALPDVTARILEGWNALAVARESKIAVISHSTSISCLVAHLKKIPFMHVGLIVIGAIQVVQIEAENTRFLHHNLITY